jgi:hypothetical protein
MVLLWVWFCAYLNCAGWVLSAIHQLNAGGYAIVLLLWFAGLFVWKQKTSTQIFPRPCHKFRRRFRRPFPLAFLILAAMAFLGGALHPPANYDALAYRVPRVLNWLAANQWHWIHTIFDRLNNRSCGIEWVSAPFIALFKTDRFLFLINVISFLFLPGLVFSVFTRLGVRRRVAWHWMWVVPTGYCFVLQAGSLANDLFGVPFALAAVDFALRAETSSSSRDFFASILAAAMMTSGKMSNLPLLLPWAIAILPSVKLIFRWPVKTFVVCALAVFASALPTAVLNVKFSNDWSGAGLGRPGVKNPVVLRTGANTVLLTIENFVPPVFPLADRWNQVMEKNLPPELEKRLAQIIEWPGCTFSLEQMQIEENAGLGFGVCALLLASVAAAAFERRRGFRAESTWLKLVRWSPVISLLAVMTQSGVSSPTRTIPPYYVLLIPILLVCAGHERLVAQRWWRLSALTVFFMAAMLLILQPARPLFPVQTILGKMKNPPARVREVYSVYHERWDAFAPARAALPPDVKVLGLVTHDDPETSLWRPFGTRRIEHVCPQDTAADLKARGIEFVLVKPDIFGRQFDGAADDWIKRMNVQVVEKIPLNLRASTGTLDWYLVRVQ